MRKKRNIFCSWLLAVQMILSMAVVPVFAENAEGSVYTAPESGHHTYNMNLDWRFLLPVPDQKWDSKQNKYVDRGHTLEMSLRNSKDTSGRYFFDAKYDENNIAPVDYYENGDPNNLVKKTGRGYRDTHGNLIEGDAWTTVSIPHSINGLQAFAHNGVDEGERGSDRSYLLYRKTITVPQGEKFIFELEGIRQAAYVWVNGQEVGYYEAGIAAMGFDISNYVTPGETAVIAVAQDGSSSRGAAEYISETKPKGTLSSTDPAAFDWSTQWGQRDGSGFQWNTVDFNEAQIGLLYDAVLHVTGSVYQTFPLYNNLKTTGNYIYADNFDIKGKTATITVDAEVRNESAANKDLTLEVNIVDPDGKLKWSFESAAKTVEKASDAGIVYATTVKDTAYQTGSDGSVIGDNVTTWETVDVAHITASYDAEDVRFWNIDDPYMYDVYTVIKDEGGNVLDVQKKTTGFRKVSYSKDDGLEINDRYAWLPGYAQRATDEWAVIGVANDWMNDYDMELLKQSNADFIRWMHVAPKPAEVRSSDKYGVAVVCPAGDKEADSSGRGWAQRVEAMRDVMIYFRNNPSVMFWETGNNAINVEHSKEMMRLKNALDPHGMRFIGSRSLQDAKAIAESDYAGTMLGNHGEKAKAAMDANGKWGPIMETEYNREEAPRRVWDDFSPPDYDYVNKYLGPGAGKTNYYDIWDMTQEDLSISAVKSYSKYYNERVGGAAGTNIYSAAAMMVWSDSNMHNRNSASENCRTSGRVDPVRQTKDSFNAVKAAQSDVPAVDILGHWSYPEVSDSTYNYFDKSSKTVNGITYEVYDKSKKLKRDPTKKTVYVVGSADVEKVELYRVTGGKEELIGTCDVPQNTFVYKFENVDVTKGDSVKAVAYDARNNVITNDEIERTYDAYSLKLTPVTSDKGWKADGSDIAFFDVEVVDKNGNVCALNYDKINFTYSGEGTYLGGYNGGMGEACFQNSTESEGLSNYFGGAKDQVSTLHKDYVYAECGTNRIFVKSTRNAGTFTLNATLCDTEGKETKIKTSASVTSSAVAMTGGLTEVMPARQTYTYAATAPVIESAPGMVSVSEEFNVDWSKAVKVEKKDDTVYYTVTLNGETLTLPVSAYEGLSNSVFAPVMPILDELKKLGADIEYTYDDKTNPDDPKLTVITGGGYEQGGHTMWCHPSETILWVDGDSDLPNDMPFIKDGEFCFEIAMILKYVDGVTTSQDTDNLTFSITYGNSITVKPISEGTAVAEITINNKPNDAVAYAAKYENGVLKNVKIVNSGDQIAFMPDKVFLWDTNMVPLAKWEKQ
jgi:beta-galactosidase